MKITLPLTFDIDPAAWAREYGLDSTEAAHTEGDGCATYPSDYRVTRDGEDVAVTDLRAGDTFTEDGYGEQQWTVRATGRDRDYVHLDLDGAGAGLPAVVALSVTLRGLLAHAEAYAAGGITPYSTDDVDPLDLLRDIVAEVKAGAVTGEAAERNAAALVLLDRLDESSESYSTDTIRAALAGDGPSLDGVRRYLDASHRHLPPQVHAVLNSLDGVVADEVGDGWLLWVPADPDQHAADYAPEGDGWYQVGGEDGSVPGYERDPDHGSGGVPEVVLALQRYARERGCDRVLIDRAAAILPGLRTYEWA